MSDTHPSAESRRNVGEAWRDRIPFWRAVVDRTGAESFLDVGCGAGHSLRALAAISADFTMSGVDLNGPLLREASAAGFDVESGTIADLALMFQPFDDLLEPWVQVGIADLASLSAPISRFDVTSYTRALAALDDASRRWVLLVDTEPTVPQKTMAVAVKALVRYAKRRLRLDQVGMAEGFGAPACFALLEKA